MNDDPARVITPAAGMQEAASLRARLTLALEALKDQDQELSRLHAKHNRLLELAINCAFDFADYQDEQEGRCGCLTGRAG